MKLLSPSRRPRHGTSPSPTPGVALTRPRAAPGPDLAALVELAIGRVYTDLRTEDSRSTYRRAWEKWARFLSSGSAPPRTPLEAGPLDVERWLQSAEMQALSPNSRRHALTIVRAFYSALVRAGALPVNPARESRVRGGPPERTPWVEPESLARLLALPAVRWGEQRDALACLLAAVLGLRRISLATARAGDVDLERGMMLVRAKGAKSYRVRLPLEAAGGLRLWIELNHLRPEDPLLPARQPNGKDAPAPISRAQLGAAMKARMLRAGIRPDEATPHALRRSYATLASAAGVPIATLQANMGHRDERQTRHYIKQSAAEIDEAPGERILQGLRQGSKPGLKR